VTRAAGLNCFAKQIATHWQVQQEPYTMSALPPKYDQAVAAN